MASSGRPTRARINQVVVVLVLAALGYFGLDVSGLDGRLLSGGHPAGNGSGDAVIARAFEHRLSDVQVRGEGEVSRILPDDNRGSRHQRFILRLDSGHTVLVAHNIDLAPRIPSLRRGDRVAFYGEYEWNERGGVIHWTHNDPDGDHPHGWLQHGDETYR